MVGCTENIKRKYYSAFEEVLKEENFKKKIAKDFERTKNKWRNILSESFLK